MGKLALFLLSLLFVQPILAETLITSGASDGS